MVNMFSVHPFLMSRLCTIMKHLQTSNGPAGALNVVIRTLAKLQEVHLETGSVAF